MRAVTTFSPKGYEQYGRKMLESYVKHWPCPIEVWYEKKPDFEHEKIIYRDIRDIEDRLLFLESARRINGSDGIIKDTYNWEFDAIKFCNKVFCQLESKDDKVFWVDADTVTHSDVPEEMLSGLLEGVSYCYFGRTTWTETGFLGFNKEHPQYKAFHHQYRKAYLDGIIFTMLQWTDCFAFDYAKIGLQGNNLSPNGQGVQHVIAESFMSEYIDHLKGARKIRGHSPESKVRWW